MHNAYTYMGNNKNTKILQVQFINFLIATFRIRDSQHNKNISNLFLAAIQFVVKSSSDEIELEILHTISS